jgi:alkaline phosphatase
MSQFSRRHFLSAAGAATGTSMVGAPHIARSAEALIATPGQKPNRIIHLVSDGMSAGTLTCADAFSQVIRQRGLTWTALFRNPATRMGMMNTRSLNSMVTDSSAASSAWGSGSRVVNGVLNTLPDGRRLTPLYALFADLGWKTGLVSTAEITHATPAGFASSKDSRGDGEGIAAEYLERKVDVLLGGANPHFDGKRRRDKRDLRAEFAKAGYSVVLDKAALDKAPLDTRLLGTFADGHLPYTIDGGNAPTLADLTRAALARLGRHDKFILQVEGARIDHAAHNSDAAAALRDQIALDEALEACVEFQKAHPDTLIVWTTDHANSNLGLNGMGGGYNSSSQRFATLAQVKMSFPEILRRIEKAGEKIEVAAVPNDPEDKLGAPPPKTGDERTKFTGPVQMTSGLRIEPAKLVDVLHETTGYAPSLRRAELFAKVLAGEYPMLFDQMNSTVTQLGQLLANRTGLGWTGNTHTADYVGVHAIGPGAERFAGFIENTDVYLHYTALAGIDHRNPSVPNLADGGPSALEVERSGDYALA